MAWEELYIGNYLCGFAGGGGAADAAPEQDGLTRYFALKGAEDELFLFLVLVLILRGRGGVVEDVES